MSTTLHEDHGVRLAIEGCGHGTLHAIYASVEESCRQKGWSGVDLLIIGGDFQSVRNAYDLNCVSMPAKYREMCDFHQYYSGQRTAPYLTIFVGGNHEASNYLFELYYGGWVAPNIYYMGAANVLRLGPLRIAGMSGIWKGYNYRKPHFERLPYNDSDLKSIYHTREMDVRKLLQVRSQVDIGISHDWPKGVEWKGNFKQLFRYKKHLEDDARSGQLGNVAAQYVLDRLRPKYWFSAHLHCKYAAVVKHDPIDVEQQTLPTTNGHAAKAKDENEIDLDIDDDDDTAAEAEGAQSVNVEAVANADEIDLELDDDIDGIAPVAPGQGLDNVAIPVTSDRPTDEPLLTAEEARAALPESFRRPEPRNQREQAPIEHPPEITNTITNFLALDKCLPNKEFLQLISVPVDHDLEPQRPLKLQYDREWLAITRAFALSEPPVLGDPDARVPPAKSQPEYKALIQAQLDWLAHNLPASDLPIPDDFARTAPVYDDGDLNFPPYAEVEEYPNPQTAAYCEMLRIPDAFAISGEERAARLAKGPRVDADAERFAAQRGRGRGGGFGRGRGRGRGGGGGQGRGYRGR
ncbi:Lariat debranching enzyme, C-terminal domain [Teratosphaeria destructans]|uniref:Lariat debranching enzyme, C-terminal domain n=1 Tax=Teratosphaeria destructans TaxID=418781 RepID=A0A9W7W6I3_9PEZI|nr:Lariat debranching enzyme, C-terminal domain [Teratosphaeria destructans]